MYLCNLDKQKKPVLDSKDLITIKQISGIFSAFCRILSFQVIENNDYFRHLPQSTSDQIIKSLYCQ